MRIFFFIVLGLGLVFSDVLRDDYNFPFLSGGPSFTQDLVFPSRQNGHVAHQLDYHWGTFNEFELGFIMAQGFSQKDYEVSFPLAYFKFHPSKNWYVHIDNEWDNGWIHQQGDYFNHGLKSSYNGRLVNRWSFSFLTNQGNIRIWSDSYDLIHFYRPILNHKQVYFKAYFTTGFGGQTSATMGDLKFDWRYGLGNLLEVSAIYNMSRSLDINYGTYSKRKNNKMTEYEGFRFDNDAFQKEVNTEIKIQKWNMEIKGAAYYNLEESYNLKNALAAYSLGFIGIQSMHENFEFSEVSGNYDGYFDHTLKKGMFLEEFVWVYKPAIDTLQSENKLQGKLLLGLPLNLTIGTGGVMTNNSWESMYLLARLDAIFHRRGGPKRQNKIMYRNGWLPGEFEYRIETKVDIFQEKNADSIKTLDDSAWARYQQFSHPREKYSILYHSYESWPSHVQFLMGFPNLIFAKAKYSFAGTDFQIMGELGKGHRDWRFSSWVSLQSVKAQTDFWLGLKWMVHY
jgi:hypothetical protein